MVEIGRPGALTAPLLERLPRLHVVEIDRDLIAHLHEQHDPARLVIHEGDALKFDFGSLVNASRWSATCRTTSRRRSCSTSHFATRCGR